MASAFGHAIASFAIGSTFRQKIRSTKFLLAGIICAILPDADAIGFKLGVAYESFWGHRGFTHSFVFAFLIAIAITFLFFRKNSSTKDLQSYVLYFFLCAASHGILDAMTTGGLGVAFFSPFNDERYFFPWRPIKVSPIGVGSFFSGRGMQVIKSEMVWIGIPALIYISIILLVNKSSQKKIND